MAREVGSRDGLVRADQIKNDAPVNIARSLARGDLKIRQIDSSHSSALLFYALASPATSLFVRLDGDLIRGAN